jgi:hypothetical protein
MFTKLSLIIIGVFLISTAALAQKKIAAPAAPLLTRTVSRHESRRFGYGGTFTIVGAPHGSITVEGWSKNEIDLTAEIEVQGATEDDMAKVVAVTGFVLDDDSNHMSLITVGMHDKTYMKRNGKNFPKALLGLPWKIDYKLRVPQIIDVEINGGAGAISVSGVEGLFRLSSPQSDVSLSLAGRVANVTVGIGSINFVVPARSWRGAGADIQLAAGKLDVELPAGFSGDIDAEILRTGKIENAYGLEPRERTSISERSVRGRAGSGGAYLKFTVGDGEIHIRKAPN